MDNDQLYNQIKQKIHQSMKDIDFKNPNDILEWFDNTCYYTNLMDMNDTVIKLVRSLKINGYCSFDDIVDNSSRYDDETLPRYLIAQCLSCLEVYGFICEPIVEYINDYVEVQSKKSNISKRLQRNQYFH